MISGLKTLYYNITRNIQSSELVDRAGNILGAVKSQALLYFLLFSGEHYLVLVLFSSLICVFLRMAKSLT